MEIPAETRRRQRLATDPAGSAWVSANAGSGKTWVLTRRVIRLLLSGADPSRLLCLTFTKAAAAEMANRVFEELARWATVPDGVLATDIAALEDAPPSPERLKAARRLFARALETPGGLKVQTIHAFCEALLQRFPLEANLAGRFEVLDDRAAALLLGEAKAEAIRSTVTEPDGPLAEALAVLIADHSDDTVDGALAGFVGEREAFAAWIGHFGSLEAALAALPEALGVPPGVNRDDLVAALSASPDFAGPILSRLIDVLDGASSSMAALANGFRAALAAPDPAARAEAWRGLFITKSLEPRKSAVTKAVETALPGTLAAFAHEAERILGLLRAIAAWDVADRTGRLARLADRVIGVYQAGKAAAGALDYDDLILKAAGLLSRSDAAAWVQYKLDEGLDHVLVDEAQDTSPKQWEIVQALAGDFFSGAGARPRVTRTFFAVGDEKQSIYSFQGAAPQLFGATRTRIGAEVRASGGAFHDLELTLSFRSTPDVVKGVDRVFERPEVHAGLGGRPTVHETVRGGEPGLVEVWPETEAATAPEPERWEDPVDRTGAGSADVLLAERIADTIAGWLRTGERIAATGKRIRPGDVLVLVRRRGAFVEAVNRALKTRDVPIAGADRLDVVGHIVTRDLIAAARVALLPEDDLTLAALARSPLGGLSENDLFALAHRRSGSLWSAVALAADEGLAPARDLRERIIGWMRRADRGDPFGFFAAIVGVDGGRAAYRARFGREADEVIDELLALALAYGDRETPSLEGFLARLADSAGDVKREASSARNEVRVMTVHGAKGLEAPVVFLVDPGAAPVSASHDPRVLVLDGAPGRPLVWAAGSGPKPAPIEEAIGRHRAAQGEEYRRLLYVGLTRARDRLIVTGLRNGRTKPDGRWHTLVREALARDCETVLAPDGSVAAWRWRSDPSRGAAAPAADEGATPPVLPLPDFLRRPPVEAAPVPLLTPSGASKLLGETSAERAFERESPDRRAAGKAAADRGRLIHTLFELLPEVAPDARAERARHFLAMRAPDLDPAERDGLIVTVLAVLDDPRWTFVFGPGSRAEVGLVGELTDAAGHRVAVAGQIDRLVVAPTRVTIVDFKTNRQVPDVAPEPYVAQLALYRRVLMPLYPGRTVDAAILWTAAPRLSAVPAADLDAMAARILTKVGTERGQPHS